MRRRVLDIEAPRARASSSRKRSRAAWCPQLHPVGGESVLDKAQSLGFQVVDITAKLVDAHHAVDMTWRFSWPAGSPSTGVAATPVLLNRSIRSRSSVRRKRQPDEWLRSGTARPDLASTPVKGTVGTWYACRCRMEIGT